MHRAAESRRRGELSILSLAGLSGLLYAVVHLTQESVFGSGAGLVGEAGAWADPSTHPRLVALLVVFGAAIIGLLVLYARMLNVCRRGALSTRTWWLALCIPALFYVGFLCSRPYFSTDLYSYAAYGYIDTLPEGNAYYQEGNTVFDTTFGLQLRALGWRGSGLSPYGPVWNDLEMVIVHMTPDAFWAIVLGKALIGAAIVSSAGLVFWILRNVHADERQTGTLAFVWNPLIVLLLAGEGHNDAFVIVMMLAGLALSVRHQVASGVLLQLIAAFTKYLPVVLLPVQVAFWWRTEEDRSRLVLRLGLGGLIGLGVAVLLYGPVWLGASTFTGTGVLGGGPSIERPFNLPGGLELFLRYTVVLAAVLAGAWRARDAESLLSSCAGVILVALLAGPQKFWPWYAAAPIALLVLTRSRTFRWTALALAASSLLASPIEELPLSSHSLFSTTTQAVAFHLTRVVPLLVFAGLSIAGELSRRSRSTWYQASNPREFKAWLVGRR